MSRQHKLMLQNNEIIVKQYFNLKVIQQSNFTAGDRQNSFLYEVSNNLCLKGYKFIKNCYINASLVFHKILVDQPIIFFDMKNN